MKRHDRFGSLGVSCTAVFAVLAVFVLPSTSRAQSALEQGPNQQGPAPISSNSNQDWGLTLGGGAIVAPIYPGASRHEVKPLPLVSLSYRNTVSMTSDGLRVDLINKDGFHFGPTLGYFVGRDESDDSHLRGMGNITPSLTAGLFGAYDFGPFEASFNVRQAITHTDNGLLGTVRFDYRTTLFAGKRAQLVVGPNLDFANTNYEQTWFGVTPSQSASSGLTAYNPKGGLRDVGLHADVSYQYSKHIIFHGLASVQRLMNDAGDSPVVQDRTQMFIGLGVGYHF